MDFTGKTKEEIQKELNDSICDSQGKINQLNERYDSLIEFEKAVQQAKDDFITWHDKCKKELENIEFYGKYSHTAKMYGNSIESFFYNFKSFDIYNMQRNLFDKMLEKIGSEIVACTEELDDCEGKINSYKLAMELNQ